MDQRRADGLQRPRAPAPVHQQG